MPLDSRSLALIKQRLDEAERNIQYIRHVLDDVVVPEAPDEDAVVSPELASVSQEEERVVQGVFDGQNMHGDDGQEYPVPPNYASKSKLVEGDVLKLTIGPDGSFVYKQIQPVERQRLVGTLVVDEHGNFGVKTTDKTYRVLLASVTFYRCEEGDEITVLVPTNTDAEWGAVEHVLHQQNQPASVP